MNQNKTILLNSELNKKITQAQNIDDCHITVTETKLENILLKNKKMLEIGEDWKTPLGVILTVITVFLTADFNKDFLTVQSDSWKLLFLIVLIISIIWLIKSLVLKYRNRNNGIEELIKIIKNKN